jgi:catechol-2,3-dioxygenase
MKLNHLDVQVSDIHKARAFFETYFGLRCTYTRRSEITFLEDETGFSFGLSNLQGETQPPVYPPDFHFGFVLEDTARVEAIYEHMQRTGVLMKAELQEGGPNMYFICSGPDNIPVEVRAPRKVKK